MTAYVMVEIGSAVRLGATEVGGVVVGVVNLKQRNGDYRVHAKVVTDGPNPPRLELKRFDDLEYTGRGNVREACLRYAEHVKAMRALCLSVPQNNTELWYAIELIVYGHTAPMTVAKERMPKEFLVFLLRRVEERKAYFAVWFAKRFKKERAKLLTECAEYARIQAGVT